MARCSKCDSEDDLFVWYIPDPHNDYPLHPELICSSCPEPRDKDYKSAYDPDFHGKMFGYQDYSVGLSYLLSDNTKGLCFECDDEIDLGEGYGSCYVPYEKWRSNQYTSIAYCQPCHRARCKRHIEDTIDPEQLGEKLDKYWEKTIDGQIK